MLTRSEVVGRVAESCYTYMQVTLVGLTGFGVWGQLTKDVSVHDEYHNESLRSGCPNYYK